MGRNIRIPREGGNTGLVGGKKGPKRGLWYAENSDKMITDPSNEKKKFKIWS